ncbi:hypothetical protein AKJ39_01570 [candidate division MSBL1 archaeon SCGC-AAA259J03]|uniref:Uncharacterized protein n=1 Tax=candidate division MSBL1 archaeon SCGC-AAA259J03 TaxID=1698269 RepID=A0A656YWN6_9EURY|nr:hypothetical protein AKJ39_01570 [candidate division MSBL1 archaeon SCGC-AAA259J03]
MSDSGKQKSESVPKNKRVMDEKPINPPIPSRRFRKTEIGKIIFSFAGTQTQRWIPIEGEGELS